MEFEEWWKDYNNKEYRKAIEYEYIKPTANGLKYIEAKTKHLKPFAQEVYKASRIKTLEEVLGMSTDMPVPDGGVEVIYPERIRDMLKELKNG